MERFVERVQASGRLFFSAEEIPRRQGSRAVEAALRRLAAKGAVRRLLTKSPAFVIVPPEHRSMGLPPVEWWLDDFMRHLGQSYYLGLLSAAADAGSSHFAPMETQVVVSRWMRPIKCGRLRLRFFQKTHVPEDLVSTKQGLWAPLRVSNPPLTAIDLATYAPCSPGQALLILADLAASISRRDLRKALDASPIVAPAQRLGFLLDRAGQEKLTPVVHEWLAGKKLAAVPLDRGGGPAEVDTQWGVQMNANLEAVA
ncbi:MAG: type IV toxin-antitoxin system AbiEi family antitoxin [Xanthobacteraceae bacterium]|nr:type IV toxin-antitoxin system AbiEi family antitoxin [Xanthobacteraceae bacterium]